MIYIILSLFWIGVIWISCLALSYFWFRIVEGFPQKETEEIINKMFYLGEI